jgi:Ni,Fe-hydrogenase I large subunit
MTMANIEGQLDIDLYPQRENGTRVELSSSRPLHATKIFIGKTPEQVLSIIPLLFSICGVAQSRAALSAIEQNLSISSKAELETARDMLVLVENAKEHLFRLFIDWPQLFDLKISNNNMPYLSQVLSKFKAALFHNGDALSLNSELNTRFTDVDSLEINALIDQLDQYLQQHVFCQPTEDWIKIKDIHSLHEWSQQCDSVAAKSISFICEQGWASQGLTDCEHLPELDENFLLEKFSASNADQFIAKPQWQGYCYETSTLSRQFEQPLIKTLYKEFDSTLITRWVARLVELANIPQQLRDMLQQLSDNSTPPADNVINIRSGKNTRLGLAQIEAARGRLIHHVEIDNGIISKYQILAPTEWNFHPQGLVAKSLSSIASSNNNKEELEKLAHLVINAIDPCVGYQLRVH